MPKRIALFILSFMLVAGAFLLYEHLSGTSITGIQNETALPAPDAAAEDRPASYEVRRPTGELEYLLGAEKFTPIKGPDGHVIPGQFALLRPFARYYTVDGKEIVAHADTGQISIDQHQLSGKTRFSPRGGRMSGHVTLTYGTQESFTASPPSAASPSDRTPGTLPASNPPPPAPGQIQVQLADDLTFDNTQRLLTSPGEVRVLSDQGTFDLGSGLTVAFNPDQKRIELFRIEKGHQIILRNVNADALGIETGGEKPPASPTATLPPPAPTPLTPPNGAPVAPPADAKAGNVPTEYKLSFADDIKATLGARSLSSTQMVVLFMAAANQMENGATTKTKTAATSPQPLAPTQNSPTGASSQSTTPPSGPAKPSPKLQDLIITWNGPMEMRPAGPGDLHLADAKDKALEALGTKAQPVVLRDGDSIANAGRLWLHAAEHRVDVEPGALGYVRLADPTRGTVTCQGASYTRDANHVRLVGPGLIEVPEKLLRRGSANASEPARTASADEAAKPLTVAFDKSLDLDLINIPDLKHPDKKATVPAVREAVFSGRMKLDGPTLQFAANQLDVRIANTRNPAAPQALEHLLATGDVVVHSFRNAAAPSAKPAQPDGITAQRLELQTTPGADGVPVPSRMLADGDVTAWNYRPYKTGETGAAGKAEPDKPERKQTVYAPHIAAALSPKPRTDTGASPASKTTSLALGDFQASHFQATGGVRIELENYAKRLIIATASTFDATPPTNKAVLNGAPNAPARVAFGEDRLAGAKILLDEGKQTFAIPGPGDFHLTLPANGKDRKKPLPLEITWANGMTFNNDQLLATFEGNVLARVLQKESDLSQLSANVLRVKLRRVAGVADATVPVDLNGAAGLTLPGMPPAAAAPGPHVATTTPASPEELTLASMTAEGKVRATAATTDDAGHRLTDMDMETEKLLYDAQSQTLTIPRNGSLLVDDLRPEKATADAGPSSRGRTVFGWDGTLTYDQAGHTITFLKNVKMVYLPTKPLRMPKGGNAIGSAKSSASRIDLQTQKLMAKLSAVATTAPATTVESPVGLGAGGNQQVDHVRAEGDSKLIVDNTQELDANVLTYDNTTHIATAEGKRASNGQVIQPATYTDPGQALERADAITWDLTKGRNAVTVTNARGNIMQNRK